MKNFIILLVILFTLTNGKETNKKIKYKGNRLVEYCVACKFIWENIDEALTEGESNIILEYDLNLSSRRKNPILISESFEYFCSNSPEIFFEACNEMFSKLNNMMNDYISGKPWLEVCYLNELCNY